jgi:hypothetical protein
MPQIEIIMSLDTAGIIQVSATDKTIPKSSRAFGISGVYLMQAGSY